MLTDVNLIMFDALISWENYSFWKLLKYINNVHFLTGMGCRIVVITQGKHKIDNSQMKIILTI